MKKDNKLKKQRIIIAIVFIIIIGYVGVYLKDVPCIIKCFTGVSCLGCGMTRAFFMPVVILIIIINRKGLKPKALSGIIWTVLILFGIVYIYRMFTPNGIVVFQPEKGLLYKIFNK